MRSCCIALAALFCIGCAARDPLYYPALPDKEGFAGMYAGASGGALIAAGGANFPDAKPWEGGKKVWYDTIYALEKPDGQWRVAGKLPRPLGYGVSVTHNDSVVCVGGSDAERHYADVFRLTYTKGEIAITPLPPLPVPLANACGALVGDVLYVAGGIESPDAGKTVIHSSSLILAKPGPTNQVWTLNPADATPSWRVIPPCPGKGRMLAMAGTLDGSFYLSGGVDLVNTASLKGFSSHGDSRGVIERRYLKDAYRYRPDQGWTRLRDLPGPLAAAPSADLFIFGGDDGAQLDVASQEHHGFERRVLRYDAQSDLWINTATLPAAHVTAPIVWWNDSWTIVSGEIRPGVRSPKVVRFVPAKECSK